MKPYVELTREGVSELGTPGVGGLLTAVLAPVIRLPYAVPRKEPESHLVAFIGSLIHLMHVRCPVSATS